MEMLQVLIGKSSSPYYIIDLIIFSRYMKIKTQRSTAMDGSFQPYNREIAVSHSEKSGTAIYCYSKRQSASISFLLFQI